MIPTRLTKTGRRMVAEAKELLSDGSHPEYARGIVELITYTLGITKEDAANRVGADMNIMYPQKGTSRDHNG